MLDHLRRFHRRVITLGKFLDNLENLDMTSSTAPDRTLITTLLAALGPIADAVRAKDARIADLERRLRDADADAAAAAAADAAADAAALAPVVETVEEIIAALAGSTVTPDVEPEPIPVVEAPAAVVDAIEQAESTTGSGPSDAAGDQSVSETPTV